MGAIRAHPWILFATASVVILADQVTKAIVLATLTPGETHPVIRGVLHWTLQRNSGAAFGIFQRFPWVFTIVAAAIAMGIIVTARRARDVLSGVALGLVLGGACGNLIDRVARGPSAFRGRVIDFIDFRVWPVFNVADMAVVCGAGLLVLASWRRERAERSQSAAQPPAAHE